MITIIVISLLSHGCFSCTDKYWQIAETKLENIEITQEHSKGLSSIKIFIPDIRLNSAIWPIPQVEEIGNGVIIIRIVQNGAGFLLKSSSSNDLIKIKREIGKRYTLIVRDENGDLHNIKDFIIK